MSLPVIKIGARKSPLARAQADAVAELLAKAGHRSEFVGITTQGDTDRRHLTEIGGAGIFATAVREALQDRRIDVAVHSLKDLPTAASEGLEIVAIPAREDTRDVLVGADFAEGITIGTGAPRRVLQLQDHARSLGIHINAVPVRGNVDTRLDLVRTGKVDAVVLAAAGLNRLGYLALRQAQGTEALAHGAVEVSGLPARLLDAESMVPAPGQGALALEISTSLSNEIRSALAELDDPAATAETLAERSFLATLEAGCTAPVGARANVKSVRGTSLDLTLTAVIGRTLGSNFSEPAEYGPPIRVTASGSGADPRQFGADLARQVLDELRHNSTA